MAIAALCVEILLSPCGVLEDVRCGVKSHRVEGGVQIEQEIIAPPPVGL